MTVSSLTAGGQPGLRRGRIGLMAMTSQVKAELANTTVTKSCCRKAEVSSMLRFAGGLHIQSGRIVVEAELDTGASARRLRRDILEVYGHQSDVVMISSGGLRKGSRYVVRVVKDGEALARQTGLLDGRGRPRHPADRPPRGGPTSGPGPNRRPGRLRSPYGQRTDVRTTCRA